MVYRQISSIYTQVRTTTTTRRLGSQVLRACVIFVDTSAGDLSMVARASLLVSSGGSAVRRRERRLRGFWRHEQLSIKMALASATHHSWQSRASVGVGAEVDVPVSVGVRSEVLTDPRPQERIQRRTVEHLAVLAPPVQILDVPVPQMVDNVMDALRLLDLPIGRAGYRSAHDLVFFVSFPFTFAGTADGGTVDGSAYRIVCCRAPAVDGRAARQHSSSA